MPSSMYRCTSLFQSESIINGFLLSRFVSLDCTGFYRKSLLLSIDSRVIIAPRLASLVYNSLLFHNGRISGIIDWGFCGLGDPAQDLGALLASYGEAFVARVCRHYPALGKGLARARFYRRQYALLQALFALRDGDQAEFDDGIAAYR